MRNRPIKKVIKAVEALGYIRNGKKGHSILFEKEGSLEKLIISTKYKETKDDWIITDIYKKAGVGKKEFMKLLDKK